MAVLSNSATIRNAKLELLLTPAMGARLIALGSKTVAAFIAVVVEKSMKSVPFVVYWSRTYLLPVLLTRSLQEMLIFCRPAVLTLKRVPAVLLPVPCAG